MNREPSYPYRRSYESQSSSFDVAVYIASIRQEKFSLRGGIVTCKAYKDKGMLSYTYKAGIVGMTEVLG